MAKTWYWISLVGLLYLTASCGHQTVSQQPNSAPASPTEAATASPEVTAASSEKSDAASGTQPLSSTDFFPNPVVASASRLDPVPVTSLIPPTAAGERVPQVDTGRSDPFASLNFTPTVVQVKPAATAPAPATVTPVPIVLPSPAPVTVNPPVIVPPTASTALPPVEVAKAPVVPQRSLAETIEISGIVQIAGKTNIIIKSPDEATSRYVTVGERLGNGKVLVKRVEMGLEPTVILEQGGREIVRAIGSSNALIGAL